MILRPRADDFRVIGRSTGRIIVGVGLLMLPPLAVSLLGGDWSPAADFLVGIGACLCAGLALETTCRGARAPSWSHGMVIAAVSWLGAMSLAAIPGWLSGHYGSYLDACFDAMSGFTTTGLFLLQDLDHASDGLNTWRHLISWAGGQGIIVVALAFLVGGGGAGAYTLYAGEAKEERLLPSVIATSRAIWFVSFCWMALGTLLLLSAGLAIGLAPKRALLHGLWVFMGGWSTGGFAPMGANLLYYHSALYELIAISVCIVGSFNFALHWAVWTGNRAELRRNVELVSFTVTMTLALVLVAAGLARLGVYPDAAALFRKVFFQVASGHTTTGFGTVYARTFVTQWGPLAMLGITLAMAIGASACSTAGGIKGMRVGVLAAALLQEARRLVSPERAVVAQRFHHLGPRQLTDALVRSAALVALWYVATYVLGTVAGVWYGADIASALFEAVSAGSNTGLSCGLTDPAMPAGLKIVYILEMWVGRLEFMGVIALLGFAAALVRGK